ncbi:hypothetical protein KA012_00040 [Candidatus Woesebacteria bacterium]|nr:hypothetical protein [Candidatus Woesebacteria bacterium]
MSLNGENLEQLSQLVDTAQTIVIALPSDALIDEVAAALAWANTLRNKGKEVQLIAATSPSEICSDLDGAQDITTQLGKQNLVVSFAYVPEQVDKVSYHIGEQTNRFYLTIRPKKGVAPLSQDSLEITYAGAEADLIIYMGVSDLEQLQPLSGEYAEFFRDTPSVVLAPATPAFGTVKIETNSAAGLCEESAQLFVQLGWDIDEAVATLLLRGIEDTTSGLTSLATTPDTFETVAVLLRAGARRNRRRDVVEQAEMPTTEVNQIEQVQQNDAIPTVNQDLIPEEAVAVPPRTFADVLNRGVVSDAVTNPDTTAPSKASKPVKKKRSQDFYI